MLRNRYLTYSTNTTSIINILNKKVITQYMKIFSSIWIPPTWAYDRKNNWFCDTLRPGTSIRRWSVELSLSKASKAAFHPAISATLSSVETTVVIKTQLFTRDIWYIEYLTYHFHVLCSCDTDRLDIGNGPGSVRLDRQQSTRGDCLGKTAGQSQLSRVSVRTQSKLQEHRNCKREE